MIYEDSRPDWFIADQGTIRPIAAAPGIQHFGWNADRAPLFRIHRSHLPLIDTDEAARWIADLRDRYKDLDENRWDARDVQTAPLGFKLKTVQHQAVDFIRARRGTLLGDEMRVGKTLTAAFSHEPEMGKLVVIAPLIAREVWLGWLRRIWPDTEIGIMVGKAYDPEQARKPIVFGHYDIITHWQNGDPIGTLILDEGHVLTNSTSYRSTAATLLANRAERAIVCTGTPIWNMPVGKKRGSGLWAVLGLIAPGAFGGFHDFARRYAAPQSTAYGTVYTGLSNGDELTARLSEVMIRRRWIDVQQDLPPITRSVAIVDLTPKQRRELDIAAQNLRESDRTSTAAELARYRDALSIVKLPATVAVAEKSLTNGEPVVIWTWHRDTADALLQLLGAGGFEVYAMTGDTAQHRREMIMAQWKQHKAAALIVTMAVGQVGIDLSHSHQPIFAEIDWTPAMISQAEMRTFHPSRAMNVTYVVADHFVDRKIVDALVRKFESASPIDLSTGEAAIASINSAFRGVEDPGDMDRFMADLLAG